MLTTRTRVGTVAVAAAVLAGGVALSARTETGAAVAPGAVTATYTCKGRVGEAVLTASRDGRRGIVEVELPGFKAPVPLYSGALRTSLTMASDDGGRVTFEGDRSPAIARGEPVRSGPLLAQVREGDRLDSAVGDRALSATVLGHRVHCTAKTKQSPGPFLF